MKPSKKIEAAVLDVYNKWLYSYLNGDVTTYNSYFDDAFHFIGSTSNEEFLNRKDTTNFFKATADQLSGNTQLRNETKIVEQFGELVFITHLFDAWFTNGNDWSFYGRFRFSNILEQNEAGWHFVYQHYSTPDSKAQEGETIGFNQISKENLELREAIKRRTKELEEKNRELEIEAALERVRARTMAMRKSEELADASSLLDEQIRGLGIETWGSAFHIYADNAEGDYEWFSSKNGTLPYYKTPREKFFLDFYIKGQQGEKFHIEEFSGAKCKVHYDYLKTIPLAGDALKDMEESGIKLPTYQIDHIAFFKYGYILFITYKPVPEAHGIFQRFAKVFEQTYTRFLDLQKAEAQAKEAQIEAALERIRSRTMAMQNSSELAETSIEMFKQMQALGMRPWACGFNIFEKDEKAVTQWMSAVDGGLRTPFTTPLTENPFFIRISEARQRGEELFVMESGGQELEETYTYMFNLAASKKALGDILVSGFEMPKFQISHCAFFSQGYLMFITYEPYPEAYDVFKRFAKVFEQTYTRFLDLQKAEAQAREAQIEVALERVRSRSMAMHKSEELLEAGSLLYHELFKLGISSLTSGYVLMDKDENIGWNYLSNQLDGTAFAKPMGVPHKETKVMRSITKSWKKQDPFHIIQLNEKGTINHQTFIAERTINFNLTAKELIAHTPKRLALQTFNFKQGYLLIVGAERLSEGNIKMMLRFTNAFQQTYTRFLDLQKTEAQAREAQIEGALERVRSRSLTMHNSEELLAVIEVVSAQLRLLDLKFDTVSFGKNYQESDFKFWLTSNGQPKPVLIQVPFFDSRVLKSVIEAQKKENDFIADVFTKEENRAWSAHMIQHSALKNFPEHVKNFILNSPGFARSSFLMQHIDLYVGNYRAIPFTNEENAIFKRFAQVFSQAYTRFLDLEKAEAQAREAQIEASLEKVRSRTMAMQSSHELADTSVIVFKQLLELGIAPNRLFIGIINDKANAIEAWATNEDGSKIERHFELYTSENKSIKKMVEGWKKQLKSTIIDMKGKELQAYFHYLNTVMKIPFIDGLKQKRRIQTIAYFSGGLIGMAAPEEQPKETLLLLERFAAVFNLTYTRFKDLKIAEAHAIKAKEDLIKLQAAKKSAEEALLVLQQTQKQLIQAEKMASLGELTAGIAHEIQNPLNFVNNFSEVSNELIDEMNEELDKGDLEEAVAISLDIKQNLEKINHHGKRAENIVKGMLQHSRSSSGTKEPTDINVLADEYLRLAYHGLRAKDKSFNAELVTDFDEHIGNINIIPQDMGRVILNLITNAFYAVNEKYQKDNNFKPIVSVSTKKVDSHIKISVSDNGGGIPEKVKEKIFQPFFTTKPTGQGTGLGLSMSYDIVTKGHAGELTLETSNGEGTTFFINLPVNNLS